MNALIANSVSILLQIFDKIFTRREGKKGRKTEGNRLGWVWENTKSTRLSFISFKHTLFLLERQFQPFCLSVWSIQLVLLYSFFLVSRYCSYLSSFIHSRTFSTRSRTRDVDRESLNCAVGKSCSSQSTLCLLADYPHRPIRWQSCRRSRISTQLIQSRCSKYKQTISQWFLLV